MYIYRTHKKCNETHSFHLVLAVYQQLYTPKSSVIKGLKAKKIKTKLLEEVIWGCCKNPGKALEVY